VNYFTSFNCWLLPSDAKGVGPSAQLTLIYKKRKVLDLQSVQPNRAGLGSHAQLAQLLG